MRNGGCHSSFRPLLEKEERGENAPFKLGRDHGSVLHSKARSNLVEMQLSLIALETKLLGKREDSK